MIKYQGLSTLEVLEEAKNYNIWIADEILKNVTPPVLEIGAGTGNLSTHFLKHPQFYITDVDKGLVEKLKKRFAKEKKTSVELLDVAKNPPKKFISHFSTIFAINVLEHIEDDNKALRHISQMLKKNGKLLLLVPAKRVAYTKLDQELGHFRRYEKKDIEKKLLDAGYKINKIYFFNIVGLLSWIIRDKVKRENVNLKPYHIKIFDSIVPLLRFAESVIKIPVGISLIIVAQKQNNV